MRKLILVTLLFTYSAFADAYIEWREGGGPWHATPIQSCAFSKLVDFRITYAQYQSVDGNTNLDPISCAIAGKESRFHITLGWGTGSGPVEIKRTVYSTKCTLREVFYAVPALPGSYSAEVRFERRKGFAPIWSFQNQAITKNILHLSEGAATPDFRINGNVIPPQPQIVNVDGAQPIVLDGTPTECATKYFIGAWEALADWSGTQKYEWGKWFTGAPPKDIKLQQLATTYSYPPDWIRGDAARQGAPLAAGRHYVVRLCTGQPEWKCKDALIKVN